MVEQAKGEQTFTLQEIAAKTGLSAERVRQIERQALLKVRKQMEQWLEHEGFYTRFGPVVDLVSEIDDRLAIFGAGEELALSFALDQLPALPAGWRRTLFLHTEGWEKDGDPNVACGQTVAPLPSHGMAALRDVTSTPRCLRPAVGQPRYRACDHTRDCSPDGGWLLSISPQEA